MYHCKIRSINTKYLLVFRPPCAFVILLNCFKNQGWSGLFHFVTKALDCVKKSKDWIIFPLIPFIYSLYTAGRIYRARLLYSLQSLVLCLFVKTVTPRGELGCALPPTAMNARARARGVGVGMYAPEKHQSILIPLAMQLFYQFLRFGHCATWLGRVSVAFNEHFVIAICLSIFLTGDTLWLQIWCHGGGGVKTRDYRRA